MSERITWFRFSPSEWMTKTMMMSPQEKGVYITIICAIAVTGFMPDDAQICARACGVSVRAWKKIRADLMEGGHLSVSDGRLVSSALDSWVARTPREPIPVSVRRAVFERDGQCCVYCSSTDGPFHIDHVIPVSLGGGNNLENLVVSCRDCNLAKGARTAEEWMQ